MPFSDSTKLSKEEYLKRYLSDGGTTVKKKKRRKKPTGFEIVDTDIGLDSGIREGGLSDLDDDIPIVAEIVDERPDNIKIEESYRNSTKWKRIDDDSSSPNSPSNSPSSSASKMKVTLGGAKAGLSTAAEVKAELKRLKAKEESRFRKMSSDVLGRDAKTVHRDRKTGKRRDLAAEEEEKKKEQEEKDKLNEKYKRWSRGLAQISRIPRAEDVLEEMAKPLARYKDDKDLDAHLREQEREEDPMLEYIRKKKARAHGARKEKPKYKGPAPPPNRFGLQPGYRWDGVDRSGGFEQKLLLSLSNRKAVAEDRYKWSVEDM